MQTPYMQTPSGDYVPIIDVDDNALIHAFLKYSKVKEDIEQVRILYEAIPNNEEAAKILRRCLTENRMIKIFYPGTTVVLPENAEFIGSINGAYVYLF